MTENNVEARSLYDGYKSIGYQEALEILLADARVRTGVMKYNLEGIPIIKLEGPLSHYNQITIRDKLIKDANKHLGDAVSIEQLVDVWQRKPDDHYKTYALAPKKPDDTPYSMSQIIASDY